MQRECDEAYQKEFYKILRIGKINMYWWCEGYGKEEIWAFWMPKDVFCWNVWKMRCWSKFMAFFTPFTMKNEEKGGMLRLVGVRTGCQRHTMSSNMRSVACSWKNVKKRLCCIFPMFQIQFLNFCVCVFPLCFPLNIFRSCCYWNRSSHSVPIQATQTKSITLTLPKVEVRSQWQ